MRSPLPEPDVFRRFVVGYFANNVGEAILAIAMPVLLLSTSSLGFASVVYSIQLGSSFFSHQIGSIAHRLGAGWSILVGQSLLVVSFLPALGIVTTSGVNTHSDVVLVGVLLWFSSLGSSLYRKGWLSGLFTLFPETLTERRSKLSELYYLSRFVGPLVAVPAVWLGGLHVVAFGALVGALGPLWSLAAGAWPPPHFVERENSAERLRGFRVLVADRPLAASAASWIVLATTAGTGAALLTLDQLANRTNEPSPSIFGIMALSGAVGYAHNRGAGRLIRNGSYRPDQLWFVACLFAPLALAIMSVGSVLTIVVGWVLVNAIFGVAANADAVLSIERVPADYYAQYEGARDVLAAAATVASPPLVAFAVSQMGTNGALLTLAVLASLSAALIAFTMVKIREVSGGRNTGKTSRVSSDQNGHYQRPPATGSVLTNSRTKGSS